MWQFDSGPGFDGTAAQRVDARREQLADALRAAHLAGASPEELDELERELRASLGLIGGDL